MTLYEGNSLNSLVGRLSGQLVVSTLPIPRLLYTSTASATVANTTTETSIIGTGVGTLDMPATAVEADPVTTVPFWFPGKTIRVRVMGYASCATGKLRYRVKLGSVVVLDTTAIDVTGIANVRVLIQADITCRTTGASGTVMAQGQSLLDDGIGLTFPPSTSTVTVDTTASASLGVLATWQVADAGNTITTTNVTVEALN